MSQEKANTLIQILCSSFYISRPVDKELSIEEIADDFYQLTESYEVELDESLKEFDGYRFEEVEAPVFKRRREKLEQKRDRLVKSVEPASPKPIRNPDSSDKDRSFYKVDKQVENDDHQIISKWYRKFESVGGSSCYAFDEDKFTEVKNSLKEIARYQIKLKAMDRVDEVASLEGKYEYYKEFESVPDACRFYDKKLGDRVTRDRIKDQIKDNARIIEGGEEVPWSKINNRINSWVIHENKKPTRKKEIPATT